MIELVLKVTCSVLVLKVIVESVLKVIVESVLKVTCAEVGWRALDQHQVHMSQLWATLPETNV